MPHRRPPAAAALALLAVLAVPSVASANPYELFGASTRSGAMGQAVTAHGAEASSLWHNPGGLGLADPSMGVGMLFSFDQVGIRPKSRPAGYDLPDLGTTSPAIPSKYRLRQNGEVDDISNLYDFRLDAVGSFGLENLRFGVSVALPVNRLGLQKSRYADEREQYASNRLAFELLGDRSQHQVILVGVGYRVLSWLSLGAAMSIMPEGTATSTVYVADAANQKNVRISVDNEQVGRAAPIVGAIAKPLERLQLGASWRGANWFRLGIQNQIQIKGFQGTPDSFPVVQNVSMTLNYTPDQLALGAAWKGDAWLAAVDAVWSRWSQYVDTQGATATGLRDVWSIRAGGEYQATADRTLRVGLQWEPSPVPDQIGRSNYVDNDRIVANIGAAHGLDLLGRPVTIAWHLGLHHLVARDTNKATQASYPACAEGVTALCDELPDGTKDPASGQPLAASAGLQTGSPGFPGWTSWGNLLTLGIDLRWRF